MTNPNIVWGAFDDFEVVVGERTSTVLFSDLMTQKPHFWQSCAGSEKIGMTVVAFDQVFSLMGEQVVDLVA